MLLTWKCVYYCRQWRSLWTGLLPFGILKKSGITTIHFSWMRWCFTLLLCWLSSMVNFFFNYFLFYCEWFVLEELFCAMKTSMVDVTWWTHWFDVLFQKYKNLSFLYDKAIESSFGIVKNNTVLFFIKSNFVLCIKLILLHITGLSVRICISL